MAFVNFKKGLRANLPATHSAGTFYVTTDERAIYLDVDDSSRIRLGDFQEFATVEALNANPNPSTTALYYVSGINCLAKWNGSEYIQINRDTGMTSVEVTGEGNAITAAVYSADGRKLTLTKGATYMTAGDVDTKITTAVGVLGNDTEGNAYANVKAYVDAKTSGIATDAALGELQERVATAEGDIDNIEKSLATGGTTANAIAEAKKAGDDAQAHSEGVAGDLADYISSNDTALAGVKTTAEKGVADAGTAQARADEAYALADGKATMIQVNEAIAGAGHAVKADVDQSIADLDAAYKQADADLKSELEGKINAKVAQSDYDTKVAALEGEDARLAGLISDMDAAYKLADTGLGNRISALEGQITGLSGAMHFEGVVEVDPTTITEGYEDGDVVVYGAKEYVWNKGAFVEFGDVSAEGDRISALEVIVGEYGEDGKPVDGLVKDVADNTAAIAGEKARAEGKEAELAQADIDNLAAAKKYTDDEIAELNIGDYVKKADADAAYATVGHDHDDKYDAKGAAAAAQTAAESHADGLNTAMDTRVKVVEGKAHEHTNKALLDTYTQTEENLADAVAKKHEHINKAVIDGITAEKVAAWDGAQAAAEATASAALEAYKTTNNAAVALKANAADVYTKEETYTKNEVQNLISWGEF